MPLHIIKMTMIVIFVPSPPQPLLFSRVPLALPPPSSPRLPVRRVSETLTHNPPSVGPVGERREIFLSPSFLCAETVRHAETGRTQKFLLVPFTLFFLLVPLIVARARARERVSTYSYVPLSVSLSLVPPLTRSFLPRPSNDSPLSIQRFRAGLYLRHTASLSACRGRLIVARLCWPTADRVPVYGRIQASTIIVTFVGDDARNDRPLRTSGTKRPRAFAYLANHVHSMSTSLCTCMTRSWFFRKI